MSGDLFGLLTTELGRLLFPLQRAIEVPNALGEILDRLGVPPETNNDSLIAAIGAVVDIKKEIDALAATGVSSLDDILAALRTSERAFDAIRQLDANGGPLAQLPGLSGDLTQLLVSAWLLANHPLAHEIATLLTLVQPEGAQGATDAQTQGAEIIRYPYRVGRIQPSRLIALLRDPVGALRDAYGTPLLTGADADAMADALFPRVAGVLRQWGVACHYGVNPGDETLLGDSAPYMNHALVIYLTDPLRDLAAEAGVVVSLSSADRGDLGLVISPFGVLTASTSVGAFTVELDLTAGVDVFAIGRHGFTLLAESSTAEVVGSVAATLGMVGDGHGLVFGSPTGSRLEVGGAQLSGKMSLSETAQSLALSADVLSSTLVIAPGDSDGFLSSILPADGLRVKADLGLAWSNTSGLTLRGSAALDATLPIALNVGGLSVPSLHVALTVSDASVRAEISASVSASIGPVRAVVDRVGITGSFTFPDHGGNLGVANLDLGLQPPSGVGLSIDASGVVTGGGFLSHDPATGTYAGAMKLSLHDELTLSAYGLIATRLPDGKPGYSLLIFITADGFEPIPLGLGFMLQSIGGLVGVNRTFDYDVLRAGLKTDTLATLLFPRDPVGNAPALIQALAAAFPAKSGSFLLGLLARITWFTPTLITLDLGLVLEVGARTRLLVLGRVSALLPSADNDLVRLVLDTVGEVDFDAGTLAVDAVLVDSRLVHRFPITGSAAVRARWGNQTGATGPSFVLAVGGFNPRFAPPAGFPALERLSIALSKGKNPRLVCESYFAITSNTLQFGARASLYAEAIGFSLTGDIGYDVLVSWAPLHFVADFQGMVQLKRGSHSLFKLELKGTLEGPQPLRLSGKLTFEIFWVSFTVRVDATLADGPAGAGLAAVNVADLLAAAVGATANWRTQRTPGVAHGVALRSVAPTSGPLLDPLGQMVFEQQVVPLNLTRDVDTYGGAPVAGPRRFALAGKLNDASSTAVQGAFAPARYFALSDDAKLAAPSFEAMDAGLVLGDATVRYAADAIEAAPLDYEPITLNPVGQASAPADSTPYQLPVASLTAHTATGAAARAPVRQVGRARFRNAAVRPAATVQAPAWTIVRTSDGAAAPVDPSICTWSEQRAALDLLNRGGTAWTMVPAHELAVA